MRIVLADPQGSALYNWKKTGELKAEGSSITEGIGTTRITANLEGTPIDDAVHVSDQSAVTMVYRLLREEGLYVGGSTGINVCAAVETAKALGPGHTIVTLLCDRGSLYFQRLFNRDWLKSKGLRPIDRYSALIPAALMIGHHLSISALWNAAKPSGVCCSREATSSPSSAKRFWIAGSASAATIAALSFAITSFGVPFGAKRPNQPGR